MTRKTVLTHVFTFRVDEETKTAVEVIAGKEKRRPADVVRLLVLRALASFDLKKDRLA